MQGKLDPAVVLYFSREEIGEAAGAHCGACMMFIGNKRGNGHCTVVEGQIDGAVGVCGLYVHGEHNGPDMKGMKSKKAVGYVENGPSHCGSCEYYLGDASDGPCRKVKGIVEYRGCCNHWEERA